MQLNSQQAKTECYQMNETFCPLQHLPLNLFKIQFNLLNQLFGNLKIGNNFIRSLNKTFSFVILKNTIMESAKHSSNFF